MKTSGAAIVIAALALALYATSAAARPAPPRGRPVHKPAANKRPKPRPSVTNDGAHARVAINHLGDLRPAREIVGRREEPLTAEEETAKQIEKLLRGPLRSGVTGLFVADAKTGEALFAVNADDPLNPASNVKLISTAAALELLGPEFRYPTRLLGATPHGSTVHGDVYLLGSHDPTLTARDLDELATDVAARGITQIDGDIVVGRDPTRDGIYRAVIPIEIRAGEPGAPPVATLPPGMDHVRVEVTAKTTKPTRRPRLTYHVEAQRDPTGHPHVVVTIGGTIGQGGATTYPLVTRERTATAAHLLRNALGAHGVTLTGDFKLAELGDFIGDEVAAGSLPIELGRHESARLADIVARINKWSVNWLADRVIMTASALARRQPPSMELALAAMYDWLGRQQISRDDLLVDTGSGLSYRTRISAHALVSIVRSAAGFVPSEDTRQAHAWLDSLSIAGTDGTLAGRFRTSDLRGRIRGKTGTLSRAIALSGLLELDPQRPLAFSLITNSNIPLSKRNVRRAHEQLVGLLSSYLARTQRATVSPAAPAAPAESTAPLLPWDEDDGAELEGSEPDPALEAE